MQEHVELEVSLEIIMARIAQAIFNLNKGNGEENTKKLNDLIALQEEAYKGNRKAVEARLFFTIKKNVINTNKKY